MIYQRGFNGIRGIFKRLKASPKNKNGTDFLTEFQGVFESATKEYGFYVVSFCEKGDLLSQWRAYSSDGCGVAIGFDFEKLSKLCTDEERTECLYDVGPCAYTDDEQFATLMKIAAVLAPNGLGEDTKLATVCMSMTAAFSKHSGFFEEHEFRILTGPGSKKKYREVDERMTPYHEFLLSEDYSWLKEIIVGPCHQQIAIVKAIEAILEELKIDPKDKIRYSEIPYRGLKYY